LSASDLRAEIKRFIVGQQLRSYHGTKRLGYHRRTGERCDRFGRGIGLLAAESALLDRAAAGELRTRGCGVARLQPLTHRAIVLRNRISLIVFYGDVIGRRPTTPGANA
jgi:hypothetical protein